ncbi:MAG: hypothetical protein AAF481_01835 [Acidobacteriota bacterium]
MLEKLQLSTFQEHVGSKARLTLEGDPAIDLEITEVTAMVKNPDSSREPFSVLFRGPAEPVLEQAIYSLEHAGLGEMGLFLVPLGPKGDGIEYEAVFT